MADEELADLAAESELVDFDAGAVVADYATRVPGDVWMVRSGQVTLQASADGTTIDAVEPGGIFGYTPLLTGGGMEFVARATEPSTLIRLPGALVRAQFAKPGRSGFPGVDGVEREPRRPPDDRADDRQQAGRRACARRRAPGRARCVGARRGVPDDRAPRVLCADQAAGRRSGNFHRSRPADQGGRRRCLDRRTDHPGDERARPPSHRGSDRRDGADGHAGVRHEAHAGRDVARRSRRRARRRRSAGRIGQTEFHAAPLHRIGR